MRGCIVRRGKRFAVKVYLGRDAAGKERQKWVSFGSRREAERHLAVIVAQVQAGGTLPDSRLRLGDFLEQWLRDYAEGACGPVTVAGYRSIIRQHLAPAFGHVPLGRLAPQAVQEYLAGKLRPPEIAGEDVKRHLLARARHYEKRHEPARARQFVEWAEAVNPASKYRPSAAEVTAYEGPRHWRALSPTTALHHHRLLHEALHHAVRWQLVARNVAELVSPPRAVRREMRAWDEEQVRLFLAEARRSSQHYALYLAALTTGMREGELLGLRWQDVDLALGTATVQQTLYRLGGTPLFKQPKTHRSRRPVALPPVLVEELRRLREWQDETKRIADAAYKDHGLVFCQPTGKPLHAHNITQRDFRRMIERAKVPGIRFHDLRHSHATLLLRQGVHPKIVQERLGHSTPTVTLGIYSHVLPGMQEQAVKGLEERLFPRTPE